MEKKDVLENAKEVGTIYKYDVLNHARLLRGMGKLFRLLGVLAAIFWIFAVECWPMPIGAGKPFEFYAYAVVSLISGFASYFLFQVIADISVSLVLTDEEKLKNLEEGKDENTK